MNKTKTKPTLSAKVLQMFVVVLSCGILSTAAEKSEQETSAPKKTETAVFQPSGSNLKQIIFDEQKIEGKIRRPQLMLIKADQRPEFDPMVMQGIGKTKNIASLVDQSLIEKTPYDGAFKFEGTKITNYSP